MKMNMYSEGFPGYKPDTGDTEQSKEKQEAFFEKQKMLMKQMADQTNTSVEQYGMSPLVGSDGRIIIENFASENDGIYDAETVKTDIELIHALGINESNQAKMVVTALLHKVLRERFLVMRTSKFDEYIRGVDTLILDKETGDAICTFNEIFENERDEDESSSKLPHIHDTAEHGGVEVKYGVAVHEDGQFVRASVQHTPFFYLNLESSDIEKLTESLAIDFYGDISTAEREVFMRLIASIQMQKEILEEVSLPNHLRRKLGNFDILLDAFQRCADGNKSI